MTQEEKKRLEELIAKKKTTKLEGDEFKEFKRLLTLSKAGRKPAPGKETPYGNDFKWWSKDEILIRDSASFKSNYVAGRPIASNVPFVVPGVLRVTLEPQYLASNSPTDPINVWSRDLYLRMFQKYRPASSYSQADLGIAILAGVEIVKLIATYERVYGVINRYSKLNVNMPDTEAQSLGLSTAQLTYLQTHLSDFRYDLNYLIKKAARVYVPKDLSLAAQAIALFGYEYLDHDNARGCIINFTLESYGVYDDTALPTGGSIHYNNSVDTDLFDFNADNMCKALDVTLNAVLGSDSLQRIYADLIVWFGQDSSIQFEMMPENWIVVPVYSESILHELHNLEVVISDNDVTAGLVHDSPIEANVGVSCPGHYTVYQNEDRIITIGSFHSNAVASNQFNVNLQGYANLALGNSAAFITFGHAHVIDGYKTDVDAEFVTEACAFKVSTSIVSDPNTNDACAIVNTCVNYVCLNVRLYSNVPGLTIVNLSNCDTSTTSGLFFAGRLAVVDWCPLGYVTVGTGPAMRIDEIYGDLDVIIPLSPTDLTRIQRTMSLSCLHTDMTVISK